jgi:riboflavin kinase / FMN adenylyltransferase
VRATFHRHRLAPARRGSVVSVGVFDGVHVGHREILERNVARARELDLEPTVVTFRRHPKRLLLGRAPKALTSLDHRIALFRRAGIEHVVALKFDEELRAMSAAAFADEILRAGLDARQLVLGFDSKFAKNREGTPQWLREHGWPVEVVDQVIVGQRPVSSTAIREAVELGDLEAAAAMLGRQVSVLGRVVHGRALGRELGFPTANLNLSHELHPPPGVYACRARVVGTGAGPDGFWAVANIGSRPTVAPGGDGLPTIEIHLLDWSGDLYGQRLEVLFHARLRAERRFEGVDELARQIRRDVGAAREMLERDGIGSRSAEGS